MTIKGQRIIFKAKVGSQSYGTSIPTSDIDYKGVYIQNPDEILTFGYKPQIEVSKDECYYEVRRFLELLQTANPTVLEMLWSPLDCIEVDSPEFDLIRQNKEMFLTQKCKHSFGGYAVAQIKKAKGLDKKMNWEMDRVTRKTPIDFCYIYEEGKTKPLTKWLNENILSEKFNGTIITKTKDSSWINKFFAKLGFFSKIDNEIKLQQKWCGLVALDHFRDCYALYYDRNAAIAEYFGEDCNPLGFHGIQMDDSNDVRLSSVPKGILPETIVFYNKDGYSMHCKDYLEYQTWLEERNTQRYVDVQGHNQKYDGKNLLHCRRLLDTAMEIPRDKNINVRRPNADYLLKIRRGEVSLEEIIGVAEEDLKRLDDIYAACDLPSNCDMEAVNNLLLKIRHFQNAYKPIHNNPGIPA